MASDVLSFKASASLIIIIIIVYQLDGPEEWMKNDARQEKESIYLDAIHAPISINLPSGLTPSSESKRDFVRIPSSCQKYCVCCSSINFKTSGSWVGTEF